MEDARDPSRCRESHCQLIAPDQLSGLIARPRTYVESIKFGVTCRICGLHLVRIPNDAPEEAAIDLRARHASQNAEVGSGNVTPGTVGLDVNTTQQSTEKRPLL